MRSLRIWIAVAVAALITVVPAQSGTFVTQITTPAVFDAGTKQPASGVRYAPGWTERNVATAADLNAIQDALQDARNAIRVREFNVKHYGALGDGSTDDTEEIQAAITAANAAGGGLVWFPRGTYIVAPTTTVRLILYSNLTLAGEGDSSIIKIKNNNGNFATMFGPATDATSLTNVVLRDLKIDQNPSGNTTSNVNTGDSTITANVLRVYVGTDIRVERVRFDPYCGINAVTFNGTTVQRVSVKDSYFRFVRCTGAAGYDNSALYFDAFDHEATGNTFEALVAQTAFGAIETHTGPSVIANNRIDGYQHGINVVTESSGTTASNDLNVSGNTIANAILGIRLWSTTGKVMRNVLIAANVISIAQVTHSNTSRNAGIEMVYSDTLTGDYENISITGNVIQHEDEGAGRAYSSEFTTAGILAYPYAGINGLSITGNIIKRAPATGIKVGSGSGGGDTVKNVKVTGNTIVDFGQNATLTNSFQSAFFFAGPITDMVVEGNIIKDDYGTRRGINDIYWDSGGGGSATRCYFKDNLTRAADGTSFSRTLTPAMVVDALVPRNTRATPTWGANVAIDASTASWFDIDASTNVAFNINAPTNGVAGQEITITIRNTSGGALGAATWNAAYKLAAWTNPANGTFRTIRFVFNGSASWREISRTAADAAN